MSDRTVIGAYPPWLTEEPDAVARVIAEVAVRRAIFPARTLDELADRGWRAIVQDLADPHAVTGLGGDAVAERTEAFDPLAVLDGGNLS